MQSLRDLGGNSVKTHTILSRYVNAAFRHTKNVGFQDGRNFGLIAFTFVAV